MNLRPLALALLLPALSLADCREYAQHMTWLGRTVPDPGGLYEAQYSGVAVSGTYAHCTNGLGGSSVLDVYDLSGAGPAVYVGGLSLSGNAMDVVAGGNYEYVVAGTAGIHVIDISNPAAPVYLSTLDTPGSARRAVIAAGELLVADGSGGLRIYSLSQPYNPVLLKLLALAGTTVDLAVESGHAYVASGSSGTHVVDVDPPNIAFLVRTLPEPARPSRRAPVCSISPTAACSASTPSARLRIPFSSVPLPPSPCATCWREARCSLLSLPPPIPARTISSRSTSPPLRRSPNATVRS
ncbi:MAG: hypothetical protein IPK72_08950 [Candidatus Eisenbacteria bacterium]|nr:hypothetical protein [Candidatus Eisenbacteria bacterium]